MRSVRDCKVVVVGGAGFLGSHLVDHLVADRGCDVLVLDNLCAGRREFVNLKAELVHADITGSEHFLLDVFRKRRIRFVMNFAAWPYVPTSFDRPLHVFDVNCFGAIKVINAAQEAGVEAVLQVSSAEVYGSAAGINRTLTDDEAKLAARISEGCPVEPHSSYGASKAAVDAYCQVAWRERKTPVIALRQFNCLGERDVLHPYVIVEVVRQLMTQDRSKPATVKLGNNTTRDFIYAGDAVRLATELLECGDFGEVYNLGSEGSIKVYDLVPAIGEIMGFPSATAEPDDARRRPWDIYHLRSDNRKIYSKIKGRPEVSFQEALRRTVISIQQEGQRG